ncbi:MAG: iron-containing alcohol dehydrogenase [Exilibacterium sp.]
MNSFTFNTTKSIISEPGAIKHLSEICHRYRIRRPLVVTDQGVLDNKLLTPIFDQLQKTKVQVITFSDVKADLPEDKVLKALRQANIENIDGVIGFGGGSSMDTAKLVALMAGSGETLSELYGSGKAVGQRLPLIQVPTTAGAGSEVTPDAIITTGDKVKRSVAAAQMLPDVAILDAELTLTLPSDITAYTGVDAMVHAIEAYTSADNKNPYSDMLAREALTLLSSHISTAVFQGQNLEARQYMLVAACMAGQAFANASLAAVHALAQPLAMHYQIPHGLGNALLLPHVMRFNADNERAAALYTQLAPSVMHQTTPSGNDHTVAMQLVDHLQNLIAGLKLPTELRSLDIAEPDLPMLAEGAMQQSLLAHNPRELTYDDALAIYRAAY